MKITTKKQRIIVVICITVAVVAVGLVYAILAMKGVLVVPCFIKELTGISCPGCGITRAILSLMTFRFARALGYNLFAPFILLYFLWVYIFLVKGYVTKGKAVYDSPTIWVDAVMLVLAVIWCIVRNISAI